MVLSFSFFNDKSQQISIDQSIVNKVLQQTQNSCVYSCKNVNSSDINIVDTTVDGDLDIDQQCTIVGSSCLMKTLLDNTIINNISSDLSQEEATTSGFLNFAAGSSSSSDVDIKTAVRNIASQVVQNNCKTTAENDSYENISVVGSTIKGDFKIDQSASISDASCIINNLLKNFDNNTLKTTVKQKMDSGGLFWIIIVFIIVIIVLIVVGYFLFKKKKPVNTGPQSETQIILNNDYAKPRQRTVLAATPVEPEPKKEVTNQDVKKNPNINETQF